MSPFDVAGLIGVVMMLLAYGGAQLQKLDATKPPALLMNLVGSILVLLSLTQAFNLSAAVVEGAWALIALYGLVRAFIQRR
jgi:hypothetical protein